MTNPNPANPAETAGSSSEGLPERLRVMLETESVKKQLEPAVKGGFIDENTAVRIALTWVIGNGNSEPGYEE